MPNISCRFFNVYGPRLNTRGQYGAVFGNFLKQIQNKKPLTIVGNGNQTRDFIYVKDVISILEWFLDNPKINGLYNVGTGKPRSFNDIAKSIFKNTNKATSLKYINTPPKIRKQYSLSISLPKFLALY